MEGISIYLGKFKNIKPTDDALKKHVAKAIKESIGISIDTDLIKVNNNFVYIKTDSVLKSHIFINSEKITKKLEENLSVKINII